MDKLDKLFKSCVYADESGKSEDPGTPILILTTLVVYGTNAARLNGYHNYAIGTAQKFGIDTARSDFEFHSHDMFQGHGIWHTAEENIFRIADVLRRSITVPEYSFVVVKVDKNKSGYDRFRKRLHDDIKEKLAMLGVTREQINNGLKSIGIRSGPGAAGAITNLLFGLTAGLMSWENPGVQASLIVDDDFLKGQELWQLVYKIFSEHWSHIWESISPSLQENLKLKAWPRHYMQKWNLEAPLFGRSNEHFGLQLADFIAYTTKQMDNNKSSAKNFALIHETDFVQFADYEGIYTAISTKKRPKTHPEHAYKSKLHSRTT